MITSTEVIGEQSVEPSPKIDKFENNNHITQCIPTLEPQIVPSNDVELEDEHIEKVPNEVILPANNTKPALKIESNSPKANVFPTSRAAKRPLDDIQSHDSSKKPRKKFQYGNYDRYYGYRNTKGFHDIRLDAFKQHAADLFHDAIVLDIGCNNGLITMAVARDLGARSIIGLDIDRSLIGRARQQMAVHRKERPAAQPHEYPHNVTFRNGNYVLCNEMLLDLERPSFDTILCLSISKWIHLNFGDAGLKLAFRRMFRQLRSGGRLVLEAQNWKSYKRRKNLTETIAANFKSIQLQPHQFDEYLLGAEVGFERMYVLEMPNNVAHGFRRPIKVFVKAAVVEQKSPTAECVNDTNPSVL